MIVGEPFFEEGSFSSFQRVYVGETHEWRLDSTHTGASSAIQYARDAAFCERGIFVGAHATQSGGEVEVFQ